MTEEKEKLLEALLRIANAMTGFFPVNGKKEKQKPNPKKIRKVEVLQYGYILF